MDRQHLSLRCLKVFVLSLFAMAVVTCAAAQPRDAELELDSQDLFIGGEGGYHTYRIPAMIRTPDGVLHAFAEGRKKSHSDRGDIDIVVRRSTDGGVSWSPKEVLLDDGANTMGQPTPILDRRTGTLHLLFCRNNREMFATHFDRETGLLAEPIDITSVAKSLDVPFKITRMGAGPTAGLQTASGRLLAPVWVNGTIGVANEYGAGVVFSDDRGTTWQAGGAPHVPPAIAGINESTVAPLPNGDLYMTQRTNGGEPHRAMSISRDDGATWTDSQLVPDIDSDMTPIKAGLAAIEAKGDCDLNGLVLAAPEGPGRKNLALWYSPDGVKWKRLTSINNTHAGYSELAQLPSGVVGLLYEQGDKNYHQRLTFTRLAINSKSITSSQPQH